MQVNGVVAVTEGISTAGAIVWWRLSGSVDASRLRDTWEAEGLAAHLLPDTPSASTAIRRAVNEQREARRLVRPLDGGKGFAIVLESVTGDTLDYDVACKVRLDAVGRLKVEPSYHPLADAVRADYEKHLTELSGQDISAWLVGLMSKVDGVGLRDTGGIYFVPRHGIDQWRQIARALREASHNTVYEVPALKSDEAVDAILDAISAEAAAEADSMEKDLQTDLGQRALETRMGRCDSVEQKMTRYEGFLGRRLDELRGRIIDLRAQLTVAMVKVDIAEGSDSSLANL